MPDSPTLIIIVALIAPLAIVVGVGLPTWIFTRLQGEHENLVGDYQAAIGLDRKEEEPTEREESNDMWKFVVGYLGFNIVMNSLPQGVAYKIIAIMLLLAGLGFAWSVIVRIKRMKSHPDLADRLKRVPRIEALAYGVAALAAFGMATAFGLSS